ncbi:MAG: transglycosylase SLT domain-containing protein [Motiliproteus sp.]
MSQLGKTFGIQQVADNFMKRLPLSRYYRQGVVFLLCAISPLVWADHGANMGADVDAYMRSGDLKLMTEKAADYQYGKGVDRSLDRAIGLLCVAATKGYAEAQYELGWIYFNGRHGHTNEREASAWLIKAAQSGDAYSNGLIRFVGPSDLQDDSRCPLTDGQYFLSPIESKADPDVDEISRWVERLAPHYQLKPQLVMEVIRAESNFNVKALSSKDARGLMQLIPDTAERFGVEDIWDPLQNIQGGMAYLQWLLNYFEGDLKLALAGYNAGEKAVDSFRGVPPFPETRRYIRLITSKLKKLPSSKTSRD